MNEADSLQPLPMQMDGSKQARQPGQVEDKPKPNKRSRGDRLPEQLNEVVSQRSNEYLQVCIDLLLCSGN